MTHKPSRIGEALAFLRACVLAVLFPFRSWPARRSSARRTTPPALS